LKGLAGKLAHTPENFIYLGGYLKSVKPMNDKTEYFVIVWRSGHEDYVRYFTLEGSIQTIISWVRSKYRKYPAGPYHFVVFLDPAKSFLYTIKDPRQIFSKLTRLIPHIHLEKCDFYLRYYVSSDTCWIGTSDGTTRYFLHLLFRENLANVHAYDPKTKNRSISISLDQIYEKLSKIITPEDFISFVEKFLK